MIEPLDAEVAEAKARHRLTVTFLPPNLGSGTCSCDRWVATTGTFRRLLHLHAIHVFTSERRP